MKPGLNTRSKNRTPSARRQSASGFTLVELMVVLVLIGIMTAMILPEMKGSYEDALLRSSARKLVNACHLAYSQAVTSSQLHRVRLDRKAGRYVVERPARDQEMGSGFVPVKDVPGGEGELDTRIDIEVRRESQEPPDDHTANRLEVRPEQIPSTKERDTLTFHPDGTADAAEVLLKDRAGFRVALKINPITARVRIVELERE